MTAINEVLKILTIQKDGDPATELSRVMVYAGIESIPNYSVETEKEVKLMMLRAGAHTIRFAIESAFPQEEWLDRMKSVCDDLMTITLLLAATGEKH